MDEISARLAAQHQNLLARERMPFTEQRVTVGNSLMAGLRLCLGVAFCPLSWIMPCLLLAACSFGPGRVPPDRFDYNEAISRSAKEQMLINLVRLRYDDVPVFLAVDSVLTQYLYEGDVGLQGSVGRIDRNSLSTITADAAATYFEQPTVSYSPITGERFAAQLLSPIADELTFSLVQSGWPAYGVLIMSLERLNDLQNLTFEAYLHEQDEELRAFERAVRLLIDLARREAVGLRALPPDAGLPQHAVVFEPDPDEETQAVIDRFKELVGLDPARTEFRIIQEIVGRQPDEITIRARSLLALMGFLAQGVEAPAAHLEQGRIRAPNPPDEEIRHSLIPFRVRVAEARPEEAFVAVPYGGYWFYVPHEDHTSKQAFSLLNYLFQLKAPRLATTGPLVTVPTGGR
jgi:hypothetical protein